MKNNSLKERSSPQYSREGSCSIKELDEGTAGEQRGELENSYQGKGSSRLYMNTHETSNGGSIYSHSVKGP